MVNFHQHRPGIAALFNFNVWLLIAIVKGCENTYFLKPSPRWPLRREKPLFNSTSTSSLSEY